jgi:hypothetical protein
VQPASSPTWERAHLEKRFGSKALTFVIPMVAFSKIEMMRLIVLECRI